MSVRIATYTLFLLLVTTATLTAQITGAITGTVVDSSSAVVPNAAVVIRYLGTGSDLTGGKGFAINGQREKYSGLMLDGVQNTDMGNQSTQMTYPGMETISEVKILSSNYSAEYGTAGGANMLVVTRSGIRDFHGAAYEYVRNDTFDARNFFA